MASAVSRRLRPQGNPGCIEQPLPPWLLHDLLQPLHAYGLAGEQLKEAMQPVLAADKGLSRLWEVTESVIRTQERLLRSLRQFLNLRTVQLPLEMQRVTLEAIAWPLCMKHEAARFEGFDGSSVTTQPERLNELLSCVVENALAHSRTQVTVAARAVAGGVRIDVVDDGSGLAADIVERLGMPFLRSEARGPASRAGLGLGVHVAARNAELLGVPFEVESVAGKGCRFSVTLARAALPGRGMAAGLADPLEGARVLVVDRDGRHGQALLKLLSAWRCRAELALAWDAPLARRVRQEGRDVLLLDDGVWSQHRAEIDALGSGSGEDAAARVVFVMKAKAAPASAGVLAEGDAGCARVLHLPLTPSRLRAALGDALRRRLAPSG